MTARLILAGLFLAAAIPVAAQAQLQTVERVRSLYVTAAYEEALAAIPAASANAGETATIELEQYRGLCLLALGREAEATAAVERLVKAHPTYAPPEDMSPRMRSVFDNARAKLVPEMARQAYADAKAAFDAKKSEAANGFERAIELIDSLPEGQKKELSDLRQLASGFLDLSAARPDPVPALPAAPKDTETPAADQEYVGPVPIREDLPVWTPPDAQAMAAEYVGLLQVSIGADGKVLAATMVKSSHPLYDAAIVRAAQLWTYQPATRGGRPVPSYKNIQVRLVPR